MSKKLVIAEKPSVASDIARALGGMSRKNDYFENDEYAVSSAVGHLLEIVVPPSHDVKKGKWTFKQLPVIPPHFDLAPIERSAKRLDVLLKLIRRKDISGIVNACDAGREGELIFRYLVQHSGTKKPIERLWLQSMTAASIRDGFQSLRPDRELLPLADAAKCRSEADWLVGINGTRAMTAFNSKEGGFYLTTVGRVQTPTLAILVEREEKIRAFVARDYWEVHARFEVKAGEYAGRWFDPSFRKDDDAERKAERLWSSAEAERIADACRGGKGQVSEETRPATQASPLLFDLTSLQREANSRFGFSAKMTLSLAQALYERHKVLTYPRTDSRALPEDYVGTVKKTIETLSAGDRVCAVRQARAEKRMGKAEPARVRQYEDLGSLRDHSDRSVAQALERSRAEALRLRGAALPCGVLSARRVPANHPDHPRSVSTSSAPTAACS
jgi:DNA topoisomerase-3